MLDNVFPVFFSSWFGRGLGDSGFANYDLAARAGGVGAAT